MPVFWAVHVSKYCPGGVPASVLAFWEELPKTGNPRELKVPALSAPRPVTKSRRVIANFVPQISCSPLGHANMRICGARCKLTGQINSPGLLVGILAELAPLSRNRNAVPSERLVVLDFSSRKIQPRRRRVGYTYAGSALELESRDKLATSRSEVSACAGDAISKEAETIGNASVAPKLRSLEGI